MSNRLKLDLEDLDPDQYAAVTAPRGPLAIIAGAGTGKTRTITHRIAYLIDKGFVSPQRILAVTFTVRAAGEMRERLHVMGAGTVPTATFHAAALRQLKYFWPQIAGNLQWKLIDSKFSLIARAAGSVLDNPATEQIRDIVSEIEWAKASLISAQDYEEEAGKRTRETPAPAEAIAKIYARYEQMKTSPEGMLLDFDDLLIYTAGAIENHAAVRDEFREQYRSFVVDEYQDVTPLQQRVLDAWMGPRNDLTVVGDANQTIYSFTGADPGFLLGFTHRFEGAVTVRLSRDYRSTPQVVGLANQVISRARGKMASAAARLKLEGQRPDGPIPIFAQFDDEEAEAAAVAARIKRLIEEGTPASEIAILLRMNAQSMVFEQALTNAGVPFHVRGGQGFFQRPEIKQAMELLTRAAAQQQKLGELHSGVSLVSDVRTLLARIGLSPTEPQGQQARDRWQALNALAILAAEVAQANPTIALPGLVDMLRSRAEQHRPPLIDGVTIASIHAAKGLEWDAVFVIGLVEGTLPIRYAIDAGPEQIEEERRLLYVAITRAREFLHLSWALSQKTGGKKTRTRTRFLDGIAPEVAPAGAPRKTGSRRATTCGDCGKRLTTPAEKILGYCAQCGPDINPELVDALRQWRARRASAAGAPAFTIFSDATLLAIAQNRPQSGEQLLQISGIGPAKLDLFGAQILEIIDQF